LNTLTLSSDAENPRFVYEWRQEQERTLRAAKGAGMTEEQVNHFVDGCTYPELWTHEIELISTLREDYPSYELFTETLRGGAFKPGSHQPGASASNAEWQGRQLRLVVDRNRRVQEVIKI
jgi:D-glycerate 3-kinase